MKTLAHISIKGSSSAELTSMYKSLEDSYPKFFKMDGLSRLGYVASEILLRSLSEERFVPREDRAVIMCGRNGSLSCDINYQASLCESAYFPSPSLFVYTLPNIVTGEVAIRNKYHGETCFYALATYDESKVMSLMKQSLNDCTQVLGGWVDIKPNNHFEANISLITK